MPKGPLSKPTPIASGLFLDQSTKAIGFAFVRNDTLVDYGVLKSVHPHRVDRLIELETDLLKLVRHYKPALLTVEDIRYFSSNDGDTAEAMSEATFIVRKAARQALAIPRPVYRQFPNRIKFAVTGNGAAPKSTVAYHACLYWGLPVMNARGEKINYDDNMTDALAAASTWRFDGPVITKEQRREC